MYFLVVIPLFSLLMSEQIPVSLNVSHRNRKLYFLPLFTLLLSMYAVISASNGQRATEKLNVLLSDTSLLK